MTAERWNDLLAEALAVVRASNPERAVLVGPVRWNIVDALPTLRLPDDEHLIATVHYYSPFRFTHQGAGWLERRRRVARHLLGNRRRTSARAHDLEGAAAWAATAAAALPRRVRTPRDRRRLAARAAWTTLVREEAERLGIGWATGTSPPTSAPSTSTATPGARPSGRRCSADYQRWCTCGAMRSS